MRTKQFAPILIAVLATVGVLAQQQASSQSEPSTAKLRQHITYLASDALEGRRTGSTGANDAAHYIAGEFSRLGLRPAGQKNGTRKLSEVMSRYLQRFPYVAGLELGPANSLSVQSAGNTRTFKAGEDWMPVGFSSNQRIANAKTVFAGYGITSSELKYDDYSASNVRNEVAVVLSGTPDGDNPHGKFATAGEVRFKVAAARAAGARALVIIASEKELKDDRLSRLAYDNAGEADIPVIVVSRQIANQILGDPNRSLADYEKVADSKAGVATSGSETRISGRELARTLSLRLPSTDAVLNLT